MKRVNYSDEINSLRNRTAQLANLLEQVASEDWPRCDRAFAELKTLSAKPVTEMRQGLNVTDRSIPDPGNAREEFALLRRKLELIGGELDRAAGLLSERRAAIAALLAQ